MNQPDFTAIADSVIRERFELGHHPRRTATERPVAAPQRTGWYRHSGKDLYRADEQLLYRIDLIDGQFQVVKLDLRDGHEFRGDFGPRLRTWLGAKTLIEADAHEQMKGQGK